MDKQIVVYLYNGIWLRNQKERTADMHNNVDEPQKPYGKEARNKSIYHVVSFIWTSRTGKLIYSDKKAVGA